MRQLYVYETQGIKRRLITSYHIVEEETGRKIAFVERLSELEKGDTPLMIIGGMLSETEFWEQVKDYIQANKERRIIIDDPIFTISEIEGVIGKNPNVKYLLTRDNTIKEDRNTLEELAK
jgi:hypothetical protein